MKQFIVPAGGGLENLRVDDVAEPGAPGPGEIRIRHKAVGLNFIDTYQRIGIDPFKERVYAANH